MRELKHVRAIKPSVKLVIQCTCMHECAQLKHVRVLTKTSVISVYMRDLKHVSKASNSACMCAWVRSTKISTKIVTKNLWDSRFELQLWHALVQCWPRCRQMLYRTPHFLRPPFFFTLLQYTWPALLISCKNFWFSSTSLAKSANRFCWSSLKTPKTRTKKNPKKIRQKNEEKSPPRPIKI